MLIKKMIKQIFRALFQGKKMIDDDDLIWLLNWHASQCDGDWKHVNGVRIRTLDNPGWRFTVSLADTVCENEDFQEFTIDRTETDWVYCFLRHQRFEGACGLYNLPEVLRIFREWAERITVFQRNATTVKVTHHEKSSPRTYPRNPNPQESVKRFVGLGRVEQIHFNKVLKEDIFTPHVHDPYFPGGVRYAEKWEIPK
jgi:hypothetical protein